jgi:hypothetical protein
VIPDHILLRTIRKNCVKHGISLTYVDDIAQDVRLRILEDRSYYHSKYHTFIRRAIEHYEHEYKYVQLDDVYTDPVNVIDMINTEDIIKIVRQTLKSLDCSKRDKAILWFRCAVPKKLNELNGPFNISTNRVRMIEHNMLRKCYGDHSLKGLVDPKAFKTESMLYARQIILKHLKYLQKLRKFYTPKIEPRKKKRQLFLEERQWQLAVQRELEKTKTNHFKSIVYYQKLKGLRTLEFIQRYILLIKHSKVMLGTYLSQYLILKDKLLHININEVEDEINLHKFQKIILEIREDIDRLAENVYSLYKKERMQT